MGLEMCREERWGQMDNGGMQLQVYEASNQLEVCTNFADVWWMMCQPGY